MIRQLFTCFFVAVIAIKCAQAQGEWGYETGSPSSSQILAKSKGCSDKSPTQIQKTTQSQAVALVLDPLKVAKQEQTTTAIAYWLEIFALTSKSKPLADQTASYRQFLSGKLNSASRQELLTVLDFWPAIRTEIANEENTREAYRSLLRALLRVLERANSRPPVELKATAKSLVHKGSNKPCALVPKAKQEIPPPDQEAKEILGEILGPLAIAEIGCPPLTEDAINAYADMACFLYEQKHPGKTLDASDNRIVFAKLIRERFREAPTIKDKEAMVNFDVNWAVFKVLWQKGNHDVQQSLIAHWGGLTNEPLAYHDPVLNSLLHKGPWHKMLFPNK